MPSLSRCQPPSWQGTEQMSLCKKKREFTNIWKILCLSFMEISFMHSFTSSGAERAASGGLYFSRMLFNSGIVPSEKDLNVTRTDGQTSALTGADKQETQ